ncbi:hypothetical protein D3C81_2207590 [compost metagenome]
MWFSTPQRGLDLNFIAAAGLAPQLGAVATTQVLHALVVSTVNGLKRITSMPSHSLMAVIRACAGASSIAAQT